MNVQILAVFRQFLRCLVVTEPHMGDLIYLDEWRADHLRPSADAAPAFFFDLGCPLSYLSAERVERKLGDADWIPASTADAPGRGSPHRGGLRRPARAAEAQADALRLPLVWPDSFPDPVPRAQRAAAYAVAIGAGPQFALAASRLAFCGGFDLSDPETLAEAAAASAVPLSSACRLPETRPGMPPFEALPTACACAGSASCRPSGSASAGSRAARGWPPRPADWTGPRSSPEGRWPRSAEGRWPRSAEGRWPRSAEGLHPPTASNYALWTCAPAALTATPLTRLWP